MIKNTIICGEGARHARPPGRVPRALSLKYVPNDTRMTGFLPFIYVLICLLATWRMNVYTAGRPYIKQLWSINGCVMMSFIYCHRTVIQQYNTINKMNGTDNAYSCKDRLYLWYCLNTGCTECHVKHQFVLRLWCINRWHIVLDLLSILYNKGWTLHCTYADCQR